MTTAWLAAGAAILMAVVLATAWIVGRFSAFYQRELTAPAHRELTLDGLRGLAALVVVCVYIAGFSLSWGPVVWVMLAEIFPNSIRDKAMAIAVAAQWFMNWVVSVTFNIMDGSTALNASFNHGFAYFLYGGFSLLSALFVWKFVPERGASGGPGVYWLKRTIGLPLFQALLQWPWI